MKQLPSVYKLWQFLMIAIFLYSFYGYARSVYQDYLLSTDIILALGAIVIISLLPFLYIQKDNAFLHKSLFICIYLIVGFIGVRLLGSMLILGTIYFTAQSLFLVNSVTLIVYLFVMSFGYKIFLQKLSL